jgi:glycerophosphoryl diester phosphodiesterase
MSDAPILLGHRGALARAPENTMASFARALADGAAGFEFDVRVTSDGVAVLMHDERVDRTTNGRGLLRELRTEDLQALRAGSSEEIPRLTDALDAYLGRCALAMELKERVPESVLEDVADRLRSHPGARFRIASFQEEPLADARDLVPSAPRSLILRRGQPLPSERTQAELDLAGLFLRQEDVTAETVARVRKRGLGLTTYTVNDPDRAREIAALGVDAIISDDPGAIRGRL